MITFDAPTIALCEAWLLTRDASYRHAAQLGLDFIAAARNPDMAWRYKMRTGENDTSITAWMVMALRTGDLAGLHADSEAFNGAASWFYKMSDRGVTGYIKPDGMSARGEGLREVFDIEHTQAMTAAAWWGRYLCSRDAWRWSPLRGPSLEPVRNIPPVWNPQKGTTDLYYWHWGTLAMYQGKPANWKKWQTSLAQALLPAQHPTGSGSRAGSWNPWSPWGADGGRVYSTAMCVLSLEVPYRYARGFMDAPKLKEPFAAALPALKRAARDKSASVKAAAQHALARIRRDR